MKKIFTFIFAVLLSFGASAQCSELYFSEYAEGSSNNKYLEVYNPTTSAIDLSDYGIVRLNGGSTSPDTTRFAGMLAPSDVYVIANSNADSIILAQADTTSTATYYNGDDALSLIKISTLSVIDQIGTPGMDPGSEWTVGSGSTKEHTLVRKTTIDAGQTDWTVGATEWDVFPQNTWTNAGSHNSVCDPATAPQTPAPDPTAAQVDVISLFSNVYADVMVDTWRTSWSNATLMDIQVSGNDVKHYSALDFVGIETVGANSIDASGMDYFTFDAWTPNATTYRVKLVDFGADNAFGGGDDTEHEIAFANPAQGSWTNHTIDLTDFTGMASQANISQIIFSALPTAGTDLFIDNVYFSREPVLVYRVADIADAIQLDADLAPTNEDSLFELTGTVYGIDYDGNNGLSFTMIDATAGINIFNFNDVSNYVVTEGDEITARGKIDFYNGLLELFVDSIKVNSSGNMLADPTVVTKPSEATESNFIQLKKVWIADTTTVWPDNANVMLTNEDQDTFQIRIDKDIPGIVGEPVAYDTMTIVGIGGQFDNSAPYNEGYQIFPRGLSDIMEWVFVSTDDLEKVELNAYPNPTQGMVFFTGSDAWETFRVFNSIGVEVLNGTMNTQAIDLSGLENGYYFIETLNEDAKGVTKVALTK